MEYGKFLSTNTSRLIFKFITLLFEPVFSATFSRFLGSEEAGLLTVATTVVIDLVIGKLMDRAKENSEIR